MQSFAGSEKWKRHFKGERLTALFFFMDNFPSKYILSKVEGKYAIYYRKVSQYYGNFTEKFG